jgi:hypothetical protein
MFRKVFLISLLSLSACDDVDWDAVNAGLANANTSQSYGPYSAPTYSPNGRVVPTNGQYIPSSPYTPSIPTGGYNETGTGNSNDSSPTANDYRLYNMCLARFSEETMLAGMNCIHHLS